MMRSQIFQLSYQALFLVLLLSGPPVLISMALGLFVAILQAATQVQEQTLSFVVKLVAVVFTIFIMGSWLGEMILQYAVNIFTNFYLWKEM
ncbi:MAG: type III secretion system export apparatus subunit SctS [Chlamydiae bacterium]|nr:type III secretion system export apparatus subunit SctS [Chlamydiota bacterium]